MNARDLSVLVVDDDPQFVEVLSAALICCGARPHVAFTMGEARVLWREGVRLVLLDLTLPDSLPEQSIRTIPEILLAGVPRVVVITGSDVTPQLDAACRKFGASDVLAKDCDFVGRVTELLWK